MTGTPRVRERRVSLAIAGATLVFYLATTAGYGYFRDELYYLACGEHLGWGYVDHPPFIALLAWLLRHTIGTSLFALRLLPAVAAALTVYLTGRMARWFSKAPQPSDPGAAGLPAEARSAKAGPSHLTLAQPSAEFAEALACIAAVVAPVFLVLFSLFTMNAFDVLFWTIIVALAVRILAGGDPRLWLLLGIVAGIGLENKIDVLFLGFGLVAGLVLARRWRHFASPWLWAGGAAAAIIFAPHVLWQIRNGWPTLEFIEHAQRYKILPLGVGGYLAQQVLLMQPLALPVWLAGLWFMLFAKRGWPWRPLGWTYLVVLVLMLVERSKPYYLCPAYPMLFAAGAVVFAGFTAGAAARWLRPVIVAVLLVAGALIAPLTKALLPIDTLVAYQSKLPVQLTAGERGASARTWQIFADQFGWPEMVQTVARVYDSLPPDDRAHACIAASNYGEAGAVDFFGPAYGLPKAISGHNSYFLWGPDGCDGQVVILIGDNELRAREMFEDVRLAATTNCRDCMPYEAHAPIWICRRFRGGSLRAAWQGAKSYG